MKVLVPLDGSALSAAILSHARCLALPGKLELHLLSVLPADFPSEGDRRRREEQTRDELAAQVEALGRAGVIARASLVQGDPAAEILATIDGRRIDLVAMATHGAGGSDRWLRGSVAERVLRHSPAPVYLANPKSLLPLRERLPLGRVLVPLDGSEQAEAVLPLAALFARAAAAEMVLLHVDDPERAAPHPDPEEALLAAHARAGALMRHHREPLLQAGVPAVTLAAALGNPADAILAAVRDTASDLVAMTTHGRTGLARWQFGSVAENVLRHGQSPVLVQRVGSDPPGG